MAFGTIAQETSESINNSINFIPTFKKVTKTQEEDFNSIITESGFDESKEKMKERPNLMNEETAKKYIFSKGFTIGNLEGPLYKHLHMQGGLYDDKGNHIEDIHLEYDKGLGKLSKKKIDDCIRKIQTINIRVSKCIGVIGNKDKSTNIKKIFQKTFIKSFAEGGEVILGNRKVTPENFIKYIKNDGRYNLDNLNISYETIKTGETQNYDFDTNKIVNNPVYKVKKMIVDIKELNPNGVDFTPIGTENTEPLQEKVDLSNLEKKEALEKINIVSQDFIDYTKIIGSDRPDNVKDYYIKQSKFLFASSNTNIKVSYTGLTDGPGLKMKYAKIFEENPDEFFEKVKKGKYKNISIPKISTDLNKIKQTKDVTIKYQDLINELSASGTQKKAYEITMEDGNKIVIIKSIKDLYGERPIVLFGDNFNIDVNDTKTSNIESKEQLSQTPELMTKDEMKNYLKTKYGVDIKDESRMKIQKYEGFNMHFLNAIYKGKELDNYFSFKVINGKYSRKSIDEAIKQLPILRPEFSD